MVVLDQFYQITERSTKQVSFFWKVSHILCFVGAAACGFLTTFSFSQILNDFSYYCILNSQIVFSTTLNLTELVHGHTVNVQAIDVSRTTWGAISDCQFSQFTPLLAMISAVVWGAFFVMIARGGGGYASDLLSQPWTIIYPCIFCTIITLIIYIVSTLRLKQGMIGFCKQFQSQFGVEDCVDEIDIYAYQFEEEYENHVLSDFGVNQKMAVISGQIGIWMWVAQFFLLLARVLQVVDFDLHLITIISKEDEVLERITNPEDDDNDNDETSPV